MNVLVAVGGVILLVGLSVAMGTQLDTDRQRVGWREVARERRGRTEDLRRLREERRRLAEERRRLRDERRSAGPGWCADCPLWDRVDPRDEE